MPEKGPVLSSLAAIGSLIAATSCCLPVGAFLAAAGAAGAARILTPLRPWLIGFSVVALAFGFYQMYARSRCSVRCNWLSITVLWISAAVVALMLLFPQAIAGLLADHLPGGSVQ